MPLHPGGYQGTGFLPDKSRDPGAPIFSRPLQALIDKYANDPSFQRFFRLLQTAQIHPGGAGMKFMDQLLGKAPVGAGAGSALSGLGGATSLLALSGDVPSPGSSIAEQYGIGTPPDPTQPSAQAARETLQESASRFLPPESPPPATDRADYARYQTAPPRPTAPPRQTAPSRRFSPRVPQRIAGGRRGSFVSGPPRSSPRRVGPTRRRRTPSSTQGRGFDPARVGPTRRY